MVVIFNKKNLESDIQSMTLIYKGASDKIVYLVIKRSKNEWRQQNDDDGKDKELKELNWTWSGSSPVCSGR